MKFLLQIVQNNEAAGIWRGVISWSALFSSRPQESSEAPNTEALGLFDDALNHWAAHFEASQLKFKRDFTFL